MIALMFPWLSRSWSGLMVAAVVLALGGLGMLVGRGFGRRWVRFVGAGVGLAGVLLAVGAGRAMRAVGRAFGAHPPLGRLIDVGGYRMHLLAEGDARGGPTVVWIPGSHDAGINLYHLHKAIREETRSILFDRPGTGWSDPGPFPRLTSREAGEVATLLDRAGEPGPFVLVGHSYGGLLAANVARRYAGKVVAVIIADGTPPDVFTYLPGGGGPRIPDNLVRGTQATAWRKLFGIGLDPRAGREAIRDTAVARLLRTIDDRLADVQGALDAFSLKPDWATASIFREWDDPEHVADLVVYDGELGSLPVSVVVPAGKATPNEVRAIVANPAETDRALSFLEQARLRYLRISTRSELVHTPAGTGHNYPYETPEVLLDVVRRAVANGRPPIPGAQP